MPQLSSDGKRLRSYWELDTGCLPAAAEEMIHVVTKMQVGTRLGSVFGAVRGCGWGHAPVRGIMRGCVQASALSEGAEREERGVLGG